MCNVHLAAGIAVTLSSLILLTASCVQSATWMTDTETDGDGASEPTGEAAQPAYEDTFHFVVDRPDDGKDMAGGWQKATATLKFCEWRGRFFPYCWQCPVVVGMPIRAELQGRISARYAAQVATETSESVMHSRPSWAGQGEAYCLEFRPAMQAMIRGPRYKIGATVTRQ
jgi:hypothetical protein